MPAAATASFRATDPRVLLVSSLLIVVASMTTVRTIPGMLGLFLFVAAWYAVTAGAAATVRAVRRLLPFALVILIINIVLVPGPALVSIAGHRVVSAPGLHDGILFALRLGVMLMAVSVLVAGAGAEALAQGIHDLLRRVSRSLADRVAFFTFVSAAFVPLFIDEIARVQTAQAFRGGAVERGLFRRAAAVRTWLIPVLMSAVRRSGQVALAVELRDVRSRLIPSLPPLHLRAVDVAWLALAVTAVVLASLARQG
ncbi:MAG TPA: energy-coupling factor transporter transmembrane component T [Candidatus Krumholzibacteria bacterium]